MKNYDATDTEKLVILCNVLDGSFFRSKGGIYRYVMCGNDVKIRTIKYGKRKVFRKSQMIVDGVVPNPITLAPQYFDLYADGGRVAVAI